jgi:glutamate racemase
MTVTAAVVGVFDAGIGGVPLAAILDQEGHKVVYLGDAARRPYGPQPNDVVAGYVAQAEQFFAEAGCDAWVIACNTASVVASTVLCGLIPCVDMVSAVMHQYPASGSGTVGLLATAGTVASGAYAAALDTYDVHQVATEDLLRIAEEGGGDSERLRALAREAFDELRAAGCHDAVLACTDFTCVMEDLLAVADEIELVDPLDAAVRLLNQRLKQVGRRNLELPERHRLVLTGTHPVDVPSYARDRFGLELPAPEYVALNRVAGR